MQSPSYNKAKLYENRCNQHLHAADDCLVCILRALLVSKFSFFYTDTTFWLEPQWRFLHTALSEGRFPLWNPWNYCGMPQIAVSFPSLFYPPDSDIASVAFQSGSFSFDDFSSNACGGFSFLLRRKIGSSRISSIAGFNLFAVWLYVLPVKNYSLVAGAAWFPFCAWALISLDASSLRQRFWRCLVCSFSIVMLITSGRPEASTPSLALLVIYLLFSIRERYRRTHELLDDITVWRCRSMFLGLVLSLPAVLPMAEWLSVSRRATELLSPEVFLYSANWYDLLSTFIGPCLGDIRLQASQFRDLVSYSNLPAFVSCAYVGSISLVLSLWGIEDRCWRLRIPVMSNAHSESDCLPRKQHTFDTICGEAFLPQLDFSGSRSLFCSCRSPA